MKKNPVKVVTEDFIIPENSILIYNESIGRYVFYEKDVIVDDHYEREDMSSASFSVEFIESNMGILFTTVDEEDCDMEQPEMKECPGPEVEPQLTLDQIVEAWENAFDGVLNRIYRLEEKFNRIYKYIK